MQKYRNYKFIGGKNDNFKSNQKSITQKLTKDEIRKKLEDYRLVSDIRTIPLGTSLRYFKVDKHGKKLFRIGGLLNYNQKIEQGYIGLINNEGKRWTVQIKSGIFYRKMSLQEIKDEYQETIDDIEEENDKLKKIVMDLKGVIKKIKYHK